MSADTATPAMIEALAALTLRVAALEKRALNMFLRDCRQETKIKKLEQGRQIGAQKAPTGAEDVP